MTIACPATPAHVESRWRPLRGQESATAVVRLDDAWRELRRQIPGLEARVAVAALNDDLVQDAIQVLADAVIRLMRNPDGFRRKTVTVDDGSKTWEVPEGARAGELYFPDDDLDKLRPAPGEGQPGRGRAFSVMPS